MYSFVILHPYLLMKGLQCLLTHDLNVSFKILIPQTSKLCEPLRKAFERGGKFRYRHCWENGVVYIPFNGLYFQLCSGMGEGERRGWEEVENSPDVTSFIGKDVEWISRYTTKSRTRELTLYGPKVWTNWHPGTSTGCGETCSQKKLTSYLIISQV